MNFASLLFLLLLFPIAPHAGAADEPKCDDAGKIYKVCSDQEAAYGRKLEEAKRAKKMLVVVLGADWCPWCRSLHTMLQEPKFGRGFAKKYILADVGMFNGKVKVPSGESILAKIQVHAHDPKKIEGIPVLAVVSPKSGKAVLIDTEPLEKNTATAKGHDPAKVLAALEKAAGEVR